MVLIDLIEYFLRVWLTQSCGQRYLYVYTPWFLRQSDVGQSQDEWIEVPEGFAHAVVVIAGCRLILHIRNAASPPLIDETFHQLQLAFVYPMDECVQSIP